MGAAVTIAARAAAAIMENFILRLIEMSEMESWFKRMTWV
jgi:hypothetical protein